MLRNVIVLMITLIISSCVSNRPIEPQTFYYEDTPMPASVLLSVIDSSECVMPWHLENELNSCIRAQLMYNEKLSFMNQSETSNILQNVNPSIYFSSDLSFTEQFSQVDFLVIIELIEHSIVPIQREKIPACYPAQSLRSCSMLQVKARLRVVNLKGNSPRLVLQEIFTSHSKIPKEGECIDYDSACWGTEKYQSTPLSEAHRRLVSDLSCRIETVIGGY